MKTIRSKTEARVKIQKSEFLAFLYPVENVSDIRVILARHNKQFRDATHNSYAYILGADQEIEYYSDQGEPSGTAGKPILNALLRQNMTNVLAVVTRYFGGIKLGVRGLIDAYGEAVEKALSEAERIDFVPATIISIQCDYAGLEELKHCLKPYAVEINAIEYADKITAELEVPLEFLNEVNIVLGILKNQINLCLLSNNI